ncbi:PREDICTED: probable F-box protein At4g22060 [Camelina sativa]|uniref:Probable F-box protein At4g22060 n=1 Tax=Camelina sativa TaxID=90675 RepID=A0ABM0U0J7_CAMSA|nr:PREDICTED: probable F-box protein At4g22060 [Camelina sativa]
MDSPSQMLDGSSWSELPSDLMNMVFERLGFADFQRAKSTCQSWLYASRQSAPSNQIPWLIIFPEKGKNYCLLFNPEEKEKKYIIKDLVHNFSNSHCLATCGSWFFMRDPRYNLYIMNLFTRERIDLPSVESKFSKLEIERTIDDMFHVKIDGEYIGYPEKHVNIVFPLLWIDEKTKDFVVIWFLRYRHYLYLVYSRKGDNLWKHYCSEGLFVVDLVYKDHKIYLYTGSRDVKVLDFSTDIPRIILETEVNYVMSKGLPRRVYPQLGDVWKMEETYLVVTLTGEPLVVKSILRSDSHLWTFGIYKMDSSNAKWEKITCLGDEAILLDQGTTVLANDNKNINRNSIYFSGYRSFYDSARSENHIFIFNLDTHEVERPHQHIFPSIQLCDARWFVPNFK